MSDLPAPSVDVANVFKSRASVPLLEIPVTLRTECEWVSSIFTRTHLPLDLPMPRWRKSGSDFEDLLDYQRSLE